MSQGYQSTASATDQTTSSPRHLTVKLRGRTQAYPGAWRAQNSEARSRRATTGASRTPGTIVRGLAHARGARPPEQFPKPLCSKHQPDAYRNLGRVEDQPVS